MRYPTVPGPLVLVLCLFCFFIGRFMQQGANLPEPTPVQIQQGTARKLAADATNAAQKQIAVVKETPQQPEAMVPQPKVSIDPLDPVQLETWALESSGLLKLRPPMVPAASGDPNYHIIPFQILSWYPRLVVFPGFIDKERADVFIALAKKYLHPSGLAYRPGENIESDQQTRTSTGTFLGSHQDDTGVLGWVEQRIAAATLIPADNGESYNVLHYEHLQHYDSHYDTFDPKDFGPQPSQRIATVLLYLSEVIEGGETVFKKEGYGGENKEVTDWRNCDDGSYKYKPRMGDAVLFFGVKTNGDIDPHALHGGCPVKQGEKWVATKWMRSRGMAGY